MREFWHMLTTPRAVRLARDKRRLEGIARDCGCSKAMATRIAARYFNRNLENRQ